VASEAIVDLVVNAEDAEEQLNSLLRRIVDDAERTAPQIDLDVNVDDSNVPETTQNIADLAGNARNADRNTSRLSSGLRSIGSSAVGIGTVATRFTLMTGAAAGAVPVVASLGTALAQLAPAGAVAVSAFITIKAATATLKVGLIGVSDALGAVFDPDADPAKVEAALKNLSGNAQDFVRQLQTMKPALDGLRLDVQDQLFQGLAGTLRDTAQTVFPAVQSAALGFSKTFNTMASNTAIEAQKLGRTGALGKALQGGSEAFAELSKVPAQALSAIVKLSAGGASGLNRLATAFANMADSATAALTKAAGTGTLDTAINNAIDAVRQLRDIASNVFGSLANILNVAGESGVGLFDSLERITGLLQDATSKTEFADTLTALIDVGKALSDSVLPVLAAAFNGLLPVLQTLAPFVAKFVTLLGDQLLIILPELSPVLVSLAKVFGAILVALAPLIGAFTQILVDVLPALIPLFNSLAELLIQLTPLIKFFALGVAALSPLLKFTVDGLTAAINPIVLLIKWVNELTSVLVKLANVAIKSGVIPALRILSALLRGDFSLAWKLASKAVNSFVNFAVSNTRSAMSSVAQSIRGGASSALSAVRSGFGSMVSAARSRLSSVVSAARSLLGRLRSAFSGLGSQLYSSGAAMIQGLIRGILSRLSSAVAAAKRIVSSIRDYFPFSPAKKGPLSGRGYTTVSGQKLVDDFAKGLISRVRAVSRAARLVTREAQLTSSTQTLSTMSDSRAFAGLAGTALSRTGSSVGNITIMLGNEQFTDSVRTVVDGRFQTFNRTASQGVRV
jgi:phage-related protein